MGDPQSEASAAKPVPVKEAAQQLNDYMAANDPGQKGKWYADEKTNTITFNIDKETKTALNTADNPGAKEATGMQGAHTGEALTDNTRKTISVAAKIPFGGGKKAIEAAEALPKSPAIVVDNPTTADIEAFKKRDKTVFQPAVTGHIEDAGKALKEIQANEASSTATPEQKALAASISTKDVTFAVQGDKLVATLNKEGAGNLNEVLKDKDIDPKKLFGSDGAYDKEKGTITIPATDATKYNSKAVEAAVKSGDAEYVKTKLSAGQAEVQGMHIDVASVQRELPKIKAADTMARSASA